MDVESALAVGYFTLEGFSAFFPRFLLALLRDQQNRECHRGE
jgi:hypothetical protein